MALCKLGHDKKGKKCASCTKDSKSIDGPFYIITFEAPDGQQEEILANGLPRTINRIRKMSSYDLKIVSLRKGQGYKVRRYFRNGGDVTEFEEVVLCDECGLKEAPGPSGLCSTQCAGRRRRRIEKEAEVARTIEIMKQNKTGL